MKKFVVAYLSMYDNDLEQELVEAESAFEAAVSYLGYDEEDLGAATTLEDLQERLWESEEQINVLEIKPSKSAWGPGNLPPIAALRH